MRVCLALPGCRGARGLCVRSRSRDTHAPCRRKFILLVSSRDILLVVSILDITIAIYGHFISLERVNCPCFVVLVGTMGPFSPEVKDVYYFRTQQGLTSL